MLVSLISSVCKILQKRKIHINIDFTVTGWMICVIPHILKDAKYHTYSDHRKQGNNVIKKSFNGLPECEMAVTQDVFWTEYTDFDNKNGSFDGDEFMWKSKYIRYGNNHL